MRFTTARLQLLPVTAADIPNVHKLHSLPEIDEFNTLGIPKSMEDTILVVNNWLVMQNALPKAAYIFTVSIAETNEFIGLVGLKIGKPNYRNAEIWYKTDPKYWGKGYTTETVNAVLQFAFTDLQLHRIEAGCAVTNIASIRVLEKAGMVKEGRKREILPVRGQWVDNYFYAILEKDLLEGRR